MTTPNTFQTNYPFVSCVKSNDIEYVGIVINFDSFVTSIYDISSIKSEDDRKIFLEMGDVWWWESNRKIPINIFLKKEMQLFRYAINAPLIGAKISDITSEPKSLPKNTFDFILKLVLCILFIIHNWMKFFNFVNFVYLIITLICKHYNKYKKVGFNYSFSFKHK